MKKIFGWISGVFERKTQPVVAAQPVRVPSPAVHRFHVYSGDELIAKHNYCGSRMAEAMKVVTDQYGDDSVVYRRS